MEEKKQSHKAATKEEKDQREKELRTQGKKGCKAQRVNFATTPENFDYIQTVSRSSAKTYTQLLNIMIDDYKANHPGLYEQAKEMQKKL